MAGKIVIADVVVLLLNVTLIYIYGITNKKAWMTLKAW